MQTDGQGEHEGGVSGGLRKRWGYGGRLVDATPSGEVQVRMLEGRGLLRGWDPSRDYRGSLRESTGACRSLEHELREEGLRGREDRDVELARVRSEISNLEHAIATRREELYRMDSVLEAGYGRHYAEGYGGDGYREDEGLTGQREEERGYGQGYHEGEWDDRRRAPSAARAGITGRDRHHEDVEQRENRADRFRDSSVAQSNSAAGSRAAGRRDFDHMRSMMGDSAETSVLRPPATRGRLQDSMRNESDFALRELHAVRHRERFHGSSRSPPRSLAPAYGGGEGGGVGLGGGRDVGGGLGGLGSGGGQGSRGHDDRAGRSATVRLDVNESSRAQERNARMRNNLVVGFSDVIDDWRSRRASDYCGDIDERIRDDRHDGMEYTAGRRRVLDEDKSAPARRLRTGRTSEAFGRRSRSSSIEDRADCPKRRAAQPEKFDGTTSVDAFLEQFETCAVYNRWSEEDRYVHLKLCLKGSAAGLLRDCREDVRTYRGLEEKLRQRFDAKGREVSFRAQLRSRRRRKGESLQELYIAIGDMVHQAFPGKGSVHRDIAACDSFIDALDEPALEQRVRDRMPENLDEAYRLAVVLEANSRGAENKVSTDRQRERNPRYDARAAYVAAEPLGGQDVT